MVVAKDGQQAGNGNGSPNGHDLIGDDKLNPSYQLEHAENIGLGTTRYKLIEVD